jgi:RNA polymerase sigma-70 factor, ECF subfamily
MPLSEEQTLKTLLEARTRLCSGLCLLIRDVHAAEDIFQTIVIRALRESFNDEGHALAWAQVTGRRLGIDLLRSKSSHWQPLDDLLLEQIEQEWLERHSHQENETMHALHDCLENLPGHSRQLVEMRYYEGRSGEEMAAHLNCKTNAIYAKLYRLHKLLRQCLEDRLKSSASA